MKNTYIVKRDNELISFYYGENQSIYMQKIKRNQIYKTMIIENVLDYFSVSLDEKGQIYIFCQDKDGNIKLATSLGEDFKISNLFKKDFNIPERAIFSPLFFEKNISLIFNSYAEENKDNYISIKTLIEGKKWTNTENIDIFSVISGNFFEVQKLNDKDIIMVYEKVDKDIQIGYKEILDGKISSFIPFHKTGYQIVDFSFLAVNNTIHFLYIVKNLFSSQVIYRRKDERGLSSPIILYEGQKIKDCNLIFSENILYCMFTINFNLFYCTSADYGDSFSGILKYKKSFNQDIIKANFITNDNNRRTYLNQIYVDYKNPLSIQFLPEICPEYRLIDNKISEYKNKSFYEGINEQTLNNGFISDLSNQNINYSRLNNEQINNNQFEQNNTNFNNTQNVNLRNNKINGNRIYKTVMEESDFMEQFNPALFEDMLKNQNKQISNSMTSLNTNTNTNAQANQNIKSNMPNVQINMNPNVELNEKEHTEFIKNKLKIANEELEEKSNQLIKLNNIVQQKNEEKINMELELKRKIKELEEENKKLKNIDNFKRETNKEREEEDAREIKENEETEKE